MTVEFSRTTYVNAPVVSVYRTSLQVEAHTESFAHTGERAVGGVTSGEMVLGDEVTWRARHWGVPFSMTSVIVEAEPPHRFVDAQKRGPFASFRHEHLFEPDGIGTQMTDHVTFTAPLGPLGVIAERLFVSRRIRNLIDTRNAYLVERFASTDPDEARSKEQQARDTFGEPSTDEGSGAAAGSRTDDRASRGR